MGLVGLGGVGGVGGWALRSLMQCSSGTYGFEMGRLKWDFRMSMDGICNSVSDRDCAGHGHLYACVLECDTRVVAKRHKLHFRLA